jgi:hypothetical protein
MDMKDGPALLSTRWLGPPARYSGDGRSVKGHTLGDCDLFHDLVEQSAACRSLKLALHRRNDRSQSGCRDRIFRAGRMYV